MILYTSLIILSLALPANAELWRAQREQDALNEYFGGTDLVPPLVNTTYGGETDLLLHNNSELILNCSAKYPVLWTVDQILV